MLNRMRLEMGVLALALCLGTATSVYARRSHNDRMGSSEMSSDSTPTAASSGIDWSERYQFTPLEQKRLQAKGLSKEEAWAVAKAARESGRDVDDVSQMVFRGRSYFQIAEELGISYDSLFRWPARWQTPEWQEEVREGSPVWVAHPQGMTEENRGETRERRGGTRERGSMREGGQRAAAATCPVCHMQLSTTASASRPKMVTLEGKTYYCCAGCDMSKIQQ